MTTYDIILLGIAGFMICGPLLVLIVYVCARAASVGWYKSKLEHFREILKITGDKDG